MLSNNKMFKYHIQSYVISFVFNFLHFNKQCLPSLVVFEAGNVGASLYRRYNVIFEPLGSCLLHMPTK